MALFGFWVLLDVMSLVPPPSSVCHGCVVKYWISYFRALWELFAHQNYCTPWAKCWKWQPSPKQWHCSMPVSVWSAVGFARCVPPSPLPSPQQSLWHITVICTFAGPFASICQKMLSESLRLRLHDSGPQLCMQDPNLVHDPKHQKYLTTWPFLCWRKCVVCSLV